MKVITHDGTFHTDEVFAIAFLRKFVLSKSIDIIRTRDEELLKSYVNDRDCFVIDVGRKYDEKIKISIIISEHLKKDGMMEHYCLLVD